MKKTIRLLLVAVSLLAVVPACSVFEGKKVTPEAKSFLTYKDTFDTARKAYDAFCEQVVQGKVSKANEARADAAWNSFRSAYKVAFVTSNAKDGDIPPESLRASLTNFTVLLTTLLKK